MNIRKLLFLILALTFSFCSDKPDDPRLSRIEVLASESPKEALDSLDAINYDLLPDADKHYYDFLSVKVSDKAYITHSSDSLILKVIDFESKHQKNRRYPEALYYGGRVYRDIGDYPTALSYFQNALSHLSREESNLNLRANLLSQTGRLLTELSLYDEAIPYVKESIMIGEYMKDTVNLVYDLQLLGGNYLGNKDYYLAENCFNKALDLSENLPISFSAKSKMYLAAVKYEVGQLDSALNLIRNTEKQVNPIARNSALAYASKIYLKKNLVDSAYIYAYKLLHSQDSTNLEIGYQVMLSPLLRNIIPIDTINQYISDYRMLLENYYDRNKSTLTINQQCLYNYQLHEHARKDAERFNFKLKNILYISLLVILMLSVTTLLYKNKNKKNLIELHTALDNLNKLRITDLTSNSIDPDTPPTNSSEITYTDNNLQLNDLNLECLSYTYHSINKETDLRIRLKKELLNLYKKNPQTTLSNQITESDAFHKLQKYITTNQFLPYENSLWNELEEIILKSSPNFKNNLQLLTQSRLTSIDLHTAILIKCQVTPGQMAILLKRSKGAIVSRRESLCLKIFEKNLGTKIIDGIIRLL